MTDIREEYRTLASTLQLDWAQLEGSNVLITGATGLVGSLVARTLLEHNLTSDSKHRISVHVLARSAEKLNDMLGEYSEEDGLVNHIGDLNNVLDLDIPADYIIHSAAPTASSFFMSHPVETFDAIVNGTKNMLEVARKNNSQSFIYVSSMEVYGMGNSQEGTDHLLTEDEVGYINPVSVRSCYSEGKRAAENICVAYAHEYNVPARIVRLAQTFGPGIPRNDVRLFASLTRSAIAGENFVMKTTGASSRMYAYTSDAVSAILTVLLKGENGTAYNVANPATYSTIRHMADMVYKKFGTGDARVIIDVDPNAPYPPEHHLPLDVSKLEALGWKPEVDLEEMYRRLVDYLD